MRSALTTIAKFLLCVVIAVGLAGASGYLMLRSIGGGIRNGVWETDLAIGTSDAGLYQRARVALYGLWALSSTETVYFVTKTDSDGNALKRECTYRIEGKDPDTRWWSLTVYNNYFFVPNTENRYSFSKTTIEREQDGDWQIHLSGQPQAKNWLPSGDKDGELILNLRTYNPTAEFVRDVATAPLPKIVKEVCA